MPPPANHPSLWQPGQSGNPKGRPRRSESLAEIVRRSVDPHELVESLLGIVRNVGAKSSDRIAAVTALWDRGWGKPLAQVEVIPRGDLADADLGDQLDVLTDSELEALASRGLRGLLELVVPPALPAVGVVEPIDVTPLSTGTEAAAEGATLEPSP